MMQELNYIRCGDYYIPDIRLPEETRAIGRWGRMHRDYIKEHIRVAKKHLNLEKLTPDVLNDMVQAVYVHAPDTSRGQRIQDVDISYNYIGILPANLLYDVMNGKAA